MATMAEMCDRQGVTSNARPHRRPVAIDLFSGVGGLGLGFEQAGFDVLLAVEYDPVHVATHMVNFPQTEVLCRDVARLSRDQVLAAARAGYRRLHPDREWDGEIDALIGGPPCQGFSSGGKRETGDSRNELLEHFVRMVEELRPLTFCLENVSGLLDSTFDDLRERAFKRLRSAGYSLSGTLSAIDSIAFGVPQIRKRVIVLGALNGQAPVRPAELDEVVTVELALDGLATPTNYCELLTSDSVVMTVTDQARRAATGSEYARLLAGLQVDPLDLSAPRSWDPNFLSGSRLTVHRPDVVKRFSETAPGSVEPISRFYRLPLDGPSRTLRAGTGSERGAHTSPRPIHPIEPRVITVREAARLHGYPDWFRFHATNWHGHRQIGNSVPPPLARAAANSLIKALAATPCRVAQPIGPPDVSLLSLSSSAAQVHLGDVVIDQLPKKRQRAGTSQSTGHRL
jgi:DNA (cytosine-5)-methyltransferase 1